MEKLTVFLYRNILNKKIYDEFNEVLGILKDIYVTTDDGYPKFIGYKVKTESGICNYEFRNIEFLSRDNGKIIIKIKGSKEILARSYSYLLSENLLNKKIVDINGKKVIRVDDLRIVELAGEYRIVAVESGKIVRFRRYGLESLAKFL